MLTHTELNKLQRFKYFKQKYLIGEGVCGKVYIINRKYVVKKIFLPTGINVFDTIVFNSNFNKELEATIELSSFDIAPKVVYHSKPEEKIRYIVIEKLDYTLHFMLKNRIFTPHHLTKLKKILYKLQQTRFYHNDLHHRNIMWSESKNDFRIIDWGNYYIEKHHSIMRYKSIIEKATFWMNNLYKTYKCFGLIIFKLGYKS